MKSSLHLTWGFESVKWFFDSARGEIGAVAPHVGGDLDPQDVGGDLEPQVVGGDLEPQEGFVEGDFDPQVASGSVAGTRFGRW